MAHVTSMSLSAAAKLGGLPGVNEGDCQVYASGTLLGVCSSESIVYTPDFVHCVLSDGRQVQGRNLTFVDVLPEADRGVHAGSRLRL